MYLPFAESTTTADGSTVVTGSPLILVTDVKDGITTTAATSIKSFYLSADKSRAGMEGGCDKGSKKHDFTACRDGDDGIRQFDSR
jgi:hypothetical protein